MLRYLSAGAVAGANSEDRPALFVDRDGVLNERVPHGYVTSPDQLVILDLALGALGLAASQGIPIVVVTNQGAVGRGLMTEGDLTRVHAALVDGLAQRGIEIDAIYACPHHPSAIAVSDRACECRKPGSGLFHAAANDMQLRLDRSAMIGDQPSDYAAARGAGLAKANIWTIPGSLDLRLWAAEVDASQAPRRRKPPQRLGWAGREVEGAQLRQHPSRPAPLADRSRT